MAGKLPHTALVVEDSREDRFFLRRGLRAAFDKLDVIEFAYVEEAIAYLRSPERPSLSLILVDINMPRLNGFEFADAFAKLYPELRGDALFYIVSSSIDPDDLDRARSHPVVTGFLKKPIGREALARIWRERAAAT